MTNERDKEILAEADRYDNGSWYIADGACKRIARQAALGRNASHLLIMGWLLQGS